VRLQLHGMDALLGTRGSRVPAEWRYRHGETMSASCRLAFVAQRVAAGRLSVIACGEHRQDSLSDDGLSTAAAASVSVADAGGAADVAGLGLGRGRARGAGRIGAPGALVTRIGEGCVARKFLRIGKSAMDASSISSNWLSANSAATRFPRQSWLSWPRWPLFSSSWCTRS
jgi:hypothetical protein